MKNDHLIDTALKEHARLENQDDLSFLEEMEAKLDSEKIEVQEEASSFKASRYIWQTAATITFLGGAALLTTHLTQKDNDIVLNDPISPTLYTESASEPPKTYSPSRQDALRENSTITQNSATVSEEITSYLVSGNEGSLASQDEISDLIPTAEMAAAPSSSRRKLNTPQEGEFRRSESTPFARLSKSAQKPKATPGKKMKRLHDLPTGSARLGYWLPNEGVKARPTSEDRFADIPGGNQYATLVDKGFLSPLKAPLSTFSIDVDTASYTNLRKTIMSGGSIHPDSIRVEEMINYFYYDYAQPIGEHPIAIHTEVAACPWNPTHRLVKVGLQAKDVHHEERKASNLVFLLDVSGSMSPADKLPLLTQSFELLLKELNENGRVSIVVYAGRQAILMQPTAMDQDGRLLAKNTLRQLKSGGGTHGSAGITTAYQLARKAFRQEGVNRVILATDGDFNVGVTNTKQLLKLLKTQADDDIFLTVLGFGRGNLNDALHGKAHQ